MTDSGYSIPSRLLGFLTHHTPNKVFIAVLLGIVAGLASALLIPLIAHSVDLSPDNGLTFAQVDTVYLFGVEVSNARYALVFFLLCGFILLTRSLSSIFIQHVSVDAGIHLRRYLYQRITQLPISHLDRIGPSRLHATIANDVPTLMSGAEAYSVLIINLANIIGLLLFLIYLDVYIFLFIIVCIILGAISYQLPLIFSKRHYVAAREAQDRVQEGVRGLIYGSKELKLNRERYMAFLQQELSQPENVYANRFKSGNTIAIATLNYGNLVAFFTVGLVIYIVANVYHISNYTLMAIAMAMLYITGPLGGILNLTGTILKGSVALSKLTRLLDEMPKESVGEVPPTGADKVGEIRLFEVESGYQIGNDPGNRFKIGPINLTIKAGEVTFITGGNGSGKSTLGKVLSLLCQIDKGGLYLDNIKVISGNQNQYRQHISAIFTDFYLFPQIYGVESKVLDSRAHDYLKYLQLDDKVSIKNGRFSTTSLSDGQKKRLALLVSYFEDRDIYIFDEWAADQDPVYKDFFYTNILRDLKREGKIVIVISHDDKYFQLADRVVRMENGKILEIRSNNFEEKFTAIVEE